MNICENCIEISENYQATKIRIGFDGKKLYLCEHCASIFDGYESDSKLLHCPHCDKWIGDLSDPVLENLSVEHDIMQCYVTVNGIYDW